MKLVQGQGSPASGACWMSALHFYTRQDSSWTDAAPWACVSPVVRRLCIWLNDRTSDGERERLIGPHLFTPLGTATGTEDDRKRAYLCADMAVRVWAPRALEATKRVALVAFACALRALPEIVDKATAKDGASLARKARAAAYAADAAYATATAAADAAYATATAAAYAAAAYATDAAAAYATDAAYAAATAAAYATDADADAAKVVANQEILDLILRCCAIGRREEMVKPACSKEDVLCLLER